MGKRVYTAPVNSYGPINSPQDVFNLLADIQLLDREHFKALNLNTKNQVLTVDTISIGSLNSSVVHPRDLFKIAIKRSAHSLIIAHNHPSGDLPPSKEDLEVTKRLAEAGKILGIELCDHVIIGTQKYISFKKRGAVQEHCRVIHHQHRVAHLFQPVKIRLELKRKPEPL